MATCAVCVLRSSGCRGATDKFDEADAEGDGNGSLEYNRAGRARPESQCQGTADYDDQLQCMFVRECPNSDATCS
jgi:hypothetical protein